MTHVAEVPATPEDKNSTLPAAPVKESDTDAPSTESEKTLRSKLVELGDETAKKLKEILSEVDKDELKKSLDKDKALSFLAGALDSLNEKVQGLLAPKGETRKKDEGSESESSSSETAPKTEESTVAEAEVTTDSPSVEAEPEVAKATPAKPKSKPKATPGPVGAEAVKPEVKEDTSTP